MKKQYPDNVIDKILQITLETQSFAYLAVNDKGELISQGGNIKEVGLNEWEPGTNILDEALFLPGLMPMSNAYEFIPSIHSGEDIIVDVHLFRDGELTWAILVDKSTEIEWQSQARQKGNELRLLQQKLEKTHATKFEFFEALNMLALSMKDDGSFELLRPVSDRFRDLYPEIFDSDQPLNPCQKFLFIENFIIDARELWKNSGSHQRLSSGPWIERTDSGEDVALEAFALNWKGNKLLFIEILDENYEEHHEFLQIGREGVLIKNMLEHEVHKRTQVIRSREEEIALRLVCAADTRDDGETGSHIRRLGLYSELMAKHLGWTQNSIDEIRIAAPMHDIGKIGIPDHILKKPGQLSDDEFQVMMLHTEIGGRILSNSRSALVQMAREISLGHHEKWDGSGYPKGLKGEEIPISARIVAIADVFDALVHERVYKKGMSAEEALDIMAQGRGSHFDPSLFDLFIDLKEDMLKIAFNVVDPICEEIDKHLS